MSLLAVKQFSEFDRSVMTYKVITKLCPEILLNKFQQRSHYTRYDTRYSKNLQMPNNNLDYSKKTFSYTALKVWNEIPIKLGRFL